MTPLYTIIILGVAAHITTVHSSCKCGIAHRTARVVGGFQTEVNEYPWMVNPLFGPIPYQCGASLISDQWVLTARHCTEKPDANIYEQLEDWKVSLGDHDITRLTETQSLLVNVSRVIRHPYLDAALVKLASKIDFDEYDNIRPICLPNGNNQYLDAIATVAGWGRKDYDIKKSSRVLMEANLKVKECPPEFHENGISGKYKKEHYMCGFSDQYGQVKNACSGDSGGPFFTSNGGDGVTAGQNFELIGITESVEDTDGLNIKLCTTGTQFVRVTAIMEWINKKTGPLVTCPRT